MPEDGQIVDQGETESREIAESVPVDDVAEEAPGEPAAVTTEIETVRELIVRAYPEVVPELIQGTTLEEMLTSLPAAQEAYQRIAGDLQSAAPTPIPAGGGIRSSEPDLAAMSAEQLIKRGLGTRD